LKIRKSTLIIVLCGSAICGALIGLFIGLTRDLPQIRSLETFSPSAVSRIYSADKILLSEIYLEKRDPVSLERIPRHLTDALIATEDRKFYTHSGVDLKAILRAIVKDIWAGEFVEGASTITQQLAKTLFLTPRKNIVRKVKEALLAFQLERRYTKNEILELYLNQVYFGSGAYGVESAARIFFNKSVKDLSLAECALVAGMPKSPSRYSPLVNQDLALKRRNIVLKQMLDTGIITDGVYNNAIAEPLTLAIGKMEADQAPYFVDYIKKELEGIVGPAQLYKGGLTVFTTLNNALQQEAEKAVTSGLDAVEKRMRTSGAIKAEPQGALISLDITTGGIIALVGGRDYASSTYNRALSAERQPGSAFKPIVYGHAVEQGFAQNRLILDAPVVFRGAKKGLDWTPENFSGTYKGEMTLRKALSISQNIPAVRLIEMLGPEPVIRFGRKLGITSTLAPNLSLALGSSEVTLLELTSAYTVFANRGQWVKPFGILEIVTSNGRVLWQAKSQKKVVMSRQDAAIVTDMLTGVIQEGTGRKASLLKRPLAGKTGTTDQYNDALFVGFSPSVAAGVWVGVDRDGTLGDLETGARAALPIWIDYMRKAMAERPYEYFDIPDGVVRVTIDAVTGKAAQVGAQNAVSALFKKGTEPKPGG
jgi:penicillin-binding protein 1A